MPGVCGWHWAIYLFHLPCKLYYLQLSCTWTTPDQSWLKLNPGGKNPGLMLMGYRETLLRTRQYHQYRVPTQPWTKVCNLELLVKLIRDTKITEKLISTCNMPGDNTPSCLSRWPSILSDTNLSTQWSIHLWQPGSRIVTCVVGNKSKTTQLQWCRMQFTCWQRQPSSCCFSSPSSNHGTGYRQLLNQV